MATVATRDDRTSADGAHRLFRPRCEAHNYPASGPWCLSYRLSLRASAKFPAKRDFAAHGPRKALEEPLEVGPLNDEAQVRHRA